MFWKPKSVTSQSEVNHSWYYIETVFKCLFLDIGSESLQFDNASIYVQFGVTFIMFFDIFKNIPHLRGFLWLCKGRVEGLIHDMHAKPVCEHDQWWHKSSRKRSPVHD